MSARHGPQRAEGKDRRPGATAHMHVTSKTYHLELESVDLKRTKIIMKKKEHYRVDIVPEETCHDQPCLAGILCGWEGIYLPCRLIERWGVAAVSWRRHVHAPQRWPWW